MPTRTAVLARAVSAGGVNPLTLFTVPTGDTYIVKEVHMLNSAGVAATIQLQAHDAPNVLVGHFYSNTIAAGLIDHWSGWIVLGPGDALSAYHNQNGVYYWVSGSKLVGVA